MPCQSADPISIIRVHNLLSCVCCKYVALSLFGTLPCKSMNSHCDKLQLNLITVQQDATYSVYYISVGSSICFGC